MNTRRRLIEEIVTEMRREDGVSPIGSPSRRTGSIKPSSSDSKIEPDPNFVNIAKKIFEQYRRAFEELAK